MRFTIDINKIESFDEGEKEPWSTKFICYHDLADDTLVIQEKLVMSRKVYKDLPHRKGTLIALDITEACLSIGLDLEMFTKVGDHPVFRSNDTVLKLYFKEGFERIMPVRILADKLGITPKLIDSGKLKCTPFYYTICKNAGTTLTEDQFASKGMSNLLDTAYTYFDVEDDTPENYTVDINGRFWCIDPDFWEIL